MKYIFLFVLMYGFNSVNAQVCNSIYFDGTNDGLDLELPYFQNEQVGYSFEDEFTFDFWIKTSQQESSTILSFRGQGTSGYSCNGLTIRLNENGFLKFNTTLSGASVSSIFTYNQINDNEWHHIIFQRNNENKIQLFVDGELDFESDNGITGILNITQDLNCSSVSYLKNTIGYYYNQPANQEAQEKFNGYIDNFRVWDSSFDENGIIELYTNCEVYELNPIINFDFDNIINDLIIDNNSNYSAINNGANLSNDVPICCDCEILSSEISACKGSTVDITTNSILEPLWDDGSNSIVYSPLIFSDTTISVIFLDSGNVICEDSIFISVINPIVPEITQVGTTLLSSTALFYQWYYEDIELEGENSQSITDISSGNYSVYTKDENGCYAISESFLVQADESWDCLNNECIDLGFGSGIYSSLEECEQQCHSSTSINEFIDTREIKGIYNIYGQKATSSDKIQIIIYKNGSVSKQIKSN